MTFFHIYFEGLLVVAIFFTLLWGISVYIKDASIVDMFWGAGFILVSAFYFLTTEMYTIRKIIVMLLVLIWGLRLSIHIMWRNMGKGEDYRYREFRKKYGENRYWWVSFFQVFLLQGVLLWLVSAPLLGAQYFTENNALNILDFIGLAVWLIGFIFEAGGDWQLTRFKSNPENEGKLLQSGFWKYTRHPNYFGDAAVWWGFGIISMAAGSYLPALGSVLMTWLIIKVSGIAMLEKTLLRTKPGYINYMRRTSSFFPWFPKKDKKNAQQ